MMLRHLEARFLRRREEKVDPTKFIDGVMHTSGTRVLLETVHSLGEAQGIRFICPKCFHTTHHGVICWFEGKVGDDVQPGPGRWTPSGTGIDDLTFVPGEKIKAVSVQLTGGCSWHGFVRDGKAE